MATVDDYKRGWESGIAESSQHADPELIELYEILPENEICSLAYWQGYVDGWNGAIIKSTIIMRGQSAQTGGPASYPRTRKEI